MNTWYFKRIRRPVFSVGLLLTLDGLLYVCEKIGRETLYEPLFSLVEFGICRGLESCAP